MLNWLFLEMTVGANMLQIRFFTLRHAVAVMMFILLVAVTAPSMNEAKAADVGNKQNALVVHSYHLGFPWTDRIMAGMRDVFQTEVPGLDLSVEYLDAKRTSPENISSNFSTLIPAKYNKRRPDVIVVSDDAAFDMMLDIRDNYFPGVPLIFCGVNDFTDNRIAGRKAVTGVVEDFDLAATIDVGLKLHPQTKHIAVISDDTETGKINLKRFHEIKQQFEAFVEFIELSNLPGEELRTRLQQLPKDSFVLHLSYYRDRSGKTYTVPEMIEMAAEASGCPVYVAWDYVIGHRALGGYVVSGREQGVSAAQMAAKFLKGTKIDEIPILRHSPNVYMFDHLELVHFGIKESALPEGSVILNKPDSLYEKYKTWILTLGLTSLFMAILIAFLLVNISIRRRVIRELGASEERYRRVVDTANEGIWSMDAEHRTTYVNSAMASMLGNSPEEMIGSKVEDYFFSEDIELHKQRMAQRHAGKDEVYERRFRRKDGTELWTMVSAKALTGDEGTFQGSFAMFTDITIRKYTEVALSKSEMLLKTIKNSIPDLVWLKDTNGVYLNCNNSFERFFGAKESEIIGKDDFAFLEPGLAEFFRENDNKAVEAGGPRINEEWLTFATDGYHGLFETVKTPMYDDTGNLIGVLGVARDITERKKTEEALKNREQQLASAMKIAKLGHWELSIENSQFTFSDGFYDIFRTSVEELGGYTMSIEEYAKRFVHPDDRSMVAEETAKAIATNDPEYNRYLEHRFVASDGKIGYLAVYFRIVKDSSGRTVKTYGVNQDISDRVRSEEALRESEIRFKALHNASFGGIAIHDKGIILENNLGLKEMFGYSQEELSGMNGLLLIAEKSRDYVMSKILSGYEQPYEAHGVRKNGDEFPMRLEARNIPYKGKMVRAVEFRDTTEAQNAANALLAAKEAAEAATQAKSEFLANMSHEVRTPLNGVLGMLQLLQTTDQSDEQKEYILGAIRSTNRLTRLLADILDISRIEAGKLQIIEAEFSTTCLQESILEIFSPTAREKCIDFKFTLDPQMPPKLIGDETRVRQILFNLAGNAIKFTEQGTVQVHASLLSPNKSEHARVLFTVSDTGIGIADEQISNIFEPFAQAEGSYTRRYQGAGLGLSIVRKLVKMLDGEIAIDNAEGNGTTIYVSLPFKLPISYQEQGVALPTKFLCSVEKPLRILFAEDDETSLMSGMKMLERLGYFVATAKDGQESLHLLAEQDFDLILMDIQMPVMDGVEAAKAIRGSKSLGLKSQIPIIAMTAYAMTGDKEKFLAAGMNDYISKPVDMAALREVIERITSITSSTN